MKLQRFRVSATQYRIDVLPYCDAPVKVHRFERGGSSGIGISLDMQAPCRKCEKCLLFRKLKWQERMAAELSQAPRSWFTTLTFSPIHLAGIFMESYAFSRLTPTQAIERAGYAHIARYFKRLRKIGARFRYCCVFEYGEETDRLHAHILIHEIVENSLRKRTIEQLWRSNVHTRLVKAGDIQVAAYVSKYLTKHLSKPRASISYGKKNPEKKNP